MDTPRRQNDNGTWELSPGIVIEDNTTDLSLIEAMEAAEPVVIEDSDGTKDDSILTALPTDWSLIEGFSVQQLEHQFVADDLMKVSRLYLPHDSSYFSQ